MPHIEKRQAGVEVSPEMIEAGYKVYCQDDELSDISAEDFIKCIYVAMKLARPAGCSG